jgi:hypothetical protein
MHANITNSTRLTPTEMDHIDYRLVIKIIHTSMGQNNRTATAI